MPDDPLEYKAEADAALDRLAQRLRRLLQEAAGRLDPFPPFPGAFFTHGIEIEAPGVDSPERGCVVLAPDGELYELEMGQDMTALALDQTDPVALREERLKKLEDLHPRDYIVYAYSALTRVVELLLERQAEAKG
ncbi:MAG: hypothetical protein IIA23_03225 [Chloroflexi bacterium]|nr:hypothetical protein [Chloroflexota bacterium]